MRNFFLFISMALLVFYSCENEDENNDDTNNLETITDIDGNIYPIIKIGNQIWMAENLRTKKFNDGTEIPFVNSEKIWGHLNTPAFCWYNNDELENKETHGALYNWYAVNTGKLAPIGWSVPNEEDWLELEKFLIDNGYNYDGTLEGNKFAKSLAHTTGWNPTYLETGSPGKDQNLNNSTGFAGRPGGYISGWGNYAQFTNQGWSGRWWSSSFELNIYDQTDTMGIGRTITADSYFFYLISAPLFNGNSVRCIKD